METDLLGAVMIDAGNDLSTGAPGYGKELGSNKTSVWFH